VYLQYIPKIQPTSYYVSLFISIKRSTCFRRFLRPSSGAQTVHTASGICQTLLLHTASGICQILLLPAAIMVVMGLMRSITTMTAAVSSKV
jgi:hypothetical protein